MPSPYHQSQHIPNFVHDIVTHNTSSSATTQLSSVPYYDIEPSVDTEFPPYRRHHLHQTLPSHADIPLDVYWNQSYSLEFSTSDLGPQLFPGPNQPPFHPNPDGGGSSSQSDTYASTSANWTSSVHHTRYGVPNLELLIPSIPASSSQPPSPNDVSSAYSTSSEDNETSAYNLRYVHPHHNASGLF